MLAHPSGSPSPGRVLSALTAAVAPTAAAARPVAGLLLVGGAALVAAKVARGSSQRSCCADGCSAASAGGGGAVVLGLGYCGGAIARHFAEERGLQVVGTTRGDADAANARAGVRTLVVGGGSAPKGAAREGRASAASEELAAAVRGAAVVVATAPPGSEAGDPFLADEALREALRAAGASGTLIIYLSSVGIYGDQEGRDVTEETPPAPRTARAKRRLAAEEQWRELGAKRLAIVRLPGIYGALRGPLAKAREGNARIAKEGHLFSRIHVEDVVLLCSALLDRHRSGEAKGLWEADSAPCVVNCCDSDPAPQHEVSALAYELLGLPVPPAQPFDAAELSAMQRSFYEESRRMLNSKLLSIVGRLKYDSYRTGLPACAEEERRLRRPGLRDALRAPVVLLRGVRAKLAAALGGGSGCEPVRVALVDNGSLKPEATLSLRRLAAAVEAKARASGFAGGRVTVEAASARFADRVPARDLEGRPAEVLPGWLQRVAEETQGRRQKVLLLPLLIGPSHTATKTLPDAARAAATLDVEIAPTLVCLCPALYTAKASGAAALAEILASRLESLPAAAAEGAREDVVLLCDHGSPVAVVAAAREAVRTALESKLGRPVSSCCMERREGSEYDFNGPLLEAALLGLPQGARARVALLFLQEGRHAGPGGDIATIVQNARDQRPDLTLDVTGVLAGHNALVDLLVERMEKSVPLRLFHQ